MRREQGQTLCFSGVWVSRAHTICAYMAFASALVIGCWLHYHKIVTNEFFTYPDEWFPSVSATIGDRFPERSVFQVLIALTSGPRFALVLLWYLLTRNASKTLPKVICLVGILRTFTCAGWVYITSTDDHMAHDVFMIAYIILTLPWVIGCYYLSTENQYASQLRRYVGSTFFVTLIPLVYFFLQHKVHRVAGAYTTYAFFEWALILLDVAYDAISVFDFEDIEINVRTYGPTGIKLLNERTIGEKFSEINLSLAAAFLSEVYYYFNFWSMLTSLGLLVWYFPLWHMGISGYEITIFSTISPLLLASTHIRTLCSRFKVLIRFLSLIGLAAYLIPDPTTRLFAVAAGNAFSCISLATNFSLSASREQDLLKHSTAFLLGLTLSSIVKLAGKTNNLVWPTMHNENGGWNGTALLIAIIASGIAEKAQHSLNVQLRARPLKNNLAVACGFGALMFGLHTLLSDSSTMITWSWEGYPVRGPLPVPHGVLILAGMLLGTVIASRVPPIVERWLWYGLGCFGTVLLVEVSHWPSFLGSLTLSIFLPSISHKILSSAASSNPASTFGVGFLIYNILALAHVWVVAYAFVPFGRFLRERTDIVTFTMMALLGLGFREASQLKTFKRTLSRAMDALLRYIVFGLLALSITIAYVRFPTYNYSPYHSEAKLITAGIWTVHFGIDNGLWSSEKRMKTLIEEMELDVIGLLETDNQHIIQGHRDMSQYLAEELGMYADYGPGPNKHTWGAVLLSKFPILNSTHYLLPSPVGELAPAIHATLQAYGELVDIVVFHSGQEEDAEDRRLQSLEVSRIMKSSNRPLILLSYLVTKPKEGNYFTYVSEDNGMKDIDSTDWDRWCEYILYKNIRRVGYARVSRDTITDTELQVGKFVVGMSNSTEERIEEVNVAEALRFPSKFRGAGVRGHRYHVFDEPRYYA